MLTHKHREAKAIFFLSA